MTEDDGEGYHVSPAPDDVDGAAVRAAVLRVLASIGVGGLALGWWVLHAAAVPMACLSAGPMCGLLWAPIRVLDAALVAVLALFVQVLGILAREARERRETAETASVEGGDP